MRESEKVAIAAHLHVLLRRKTGRVTDTEWMAVNAEYAAEVVRFARAQAAEGAGEDLADWAGKLEAALGLDAASRAVRGTPLRPAELADEGVEAPRYVRGIR
jgi:hypothetical protein